jgi:hypothetical protein
MVALNGTATLWSKRLTAIARQRAQASAVDGVAPNCCFLLCDLCCWVVC